jgi:hypothetical protein
MYRHLRDLLAAQPVDVADDGAPPGRLVLAPVPADGGFQEPPRLPLLGGKVFYLERGQLPAAQRQAASGQRSLVDDPGPAQDSLCRRPGPILRPRRLAPVRRDLSP